MVIGIDLRPLIGKQFTGIGNYINETLLNLFKQDRQNTYKLFYNSARIKPSKFVNRLAGFNNVKLCHFKIPNKLLNLSLILFNRPYLDRLIGGCDIIWFPNLNFWQVSGRCKIAITVHDLSFYRIPWAYSKKMRLWHKLIKPQKKLYQADKIISVSENTKNDLIDLYGLAESKIEVVYPGVNRRSKTEDRRPVNLPERFILYLGTLEPRKNVEGVLQAFEKANQPDLHLVIAGGRGWLYRNIYWLASQSKAKHRIVFLDYVNQDDRWRLYQNAQVLIWPSFYEGFGFPPLEAMSVGCPVITSANSSLPEVVGEAALLVDPYNVQEIQEAINQVIKNNQLRQDLINRGYEQVKKYSWSKSAQKILEEFKNFY